MPQLFFHKPSGTRRGLFALGSVAGCLFLAAQILPRSPGEPRETREPVRGITISTHGIGLEWGSDAIVPTIAELKDVGATWISIHPYARIRADGSVWAHRGFGTETPPAYLVRPIAEAHRQGLKILVKPHLAYWGSPFRWRGEIAFGTEEAWALFWSDYTRWILDLATICREADGFVVGVELDRTLDQTDRWRSLIREVRARTGAALTYAANWSDYERVRFWDALDVIGIQAYFPVASEPGLDETAIRKGWSTWMDRLRRYGRGQNRDIVFTELGYDRSHRAAVEPWSPRADGPDAAPLQEACMRLALEAIEREPSVLGAFLWKWFPHPHPVGRDFQLATSSMKKVIREAWRGT